MPNRIIKESIWTSPNLNSVSSLAERHFYRILPLPDDHGCFQSTPVVVKGRCYPTRLNVTAALIAAWQGELERADLIRRWQAEDGREYAFFPNFSRHQRIRSLHTRRTPAPPDSILGLAVNCRQLSSIDGLNPIPIPIPIPKGPKDLTTRARVELADGVHVTEAELASLVLTLGNEQRVREYAHIVSDHVKATRGKPYLDYAAAIRNFWRRDKARHDQANQPVRKVERI